MSPRPDVSEERRDQILDAASDVFTEKGFQKSRMDDIAQESQLSKGALYWYFKSKDDIVIGIFERLFSRESRDLEALLSSDGSASDRILLYTDRVSQDVRHVLPFASMAYEFISLAFRNKYFKKAFKYYLGEHMDILVPVIQDGIDSGEFRAVDAQEAAIAVAAIFEGTLALWVYDSELVEPEYHIRTSVQFLIDGLKN
jgi:AcrR family transcriptional regulator